MVGWDDTRFSLNEAADSAVNHPFLRRRGVVGVGSSPTEPPEHLHGCTGGPGGSAPPLRGCIEPACSYRQIAALKWAVGSGIARNGPILDAAELRRARHGVGTAPKGPLEELGILGPTLDASSLRARGRRDKPGAVISARGAPGTLAATRSHGRRHTACLESLRQQAAGFELAMIERTMALLGCARANRSTTTTTP